MERMNGIEELKNMLMHFAPNNSFISYEKLVNVVQHQIDEYKKTQKKIEEHTTYYVLQEPQALKDYGMLQHKIDEWEWLLDILYDRVDILTFNEL
tara:strand:+ start:771 stop:1055 length:285 start_codon:yes stop_codon:yes gene_type:complete